MDEALITIYLLFNDQIVDKAKTDRNDQIDSNL